MAHKYRVLVVALLWMIASGAQADFLFGVKTGPMLVDVEGADVSDDPTNVGVSVGYELGVLIGGLAVEAELTRSLSAGSVAGNDLEISTQGLYASFTTAGPIYLKARVGIMDASVDAGGFSEDEGGETYGLGVGFSLGLFRVELEYTSIDDDVNFISLGLVY